NRLRFNNMSETMHKYELIKKELMKEIAQFPVGSMLPSRNQIIKKYNVGEMTVRRALNELVNEGFLIGKQGKGYFTAKNQTEEMSEISLVMNGYNSTDFFGEDISIEIGFIKYTDIFSYQNNYALNIHFHKNKLLIQNSIIDRLCKTKPKGIIIHSQILYDNYDKFRKLCETVPNTVVIDSLNQSIDFNVNLSTTDNYTSTVQMCKKLASKKYDRIIYIDLDNWENTNVSKDRLNGFKSVFEKQNPLYILSEKRAYENLDDMVKIINNELKKHKKVCMFFLGTFQLDWIYRNCKELMDSLDYLGIGLYEKPIMPMKENAHIIWAKQDIESMIKNAFGIIAENSPQKKTVLVPARLNYINF
ncbi:MAG: GntR family transcriptional regulator, partial [Armatimonadetes bacterium]|nr:GntR family transcriptional regulator [Candidatus Hippobium faecium]